MQNVVVKTRYYAEYFVYYLVFLYISCFISENLDYCTVLFGQCAHTAHLRISVIIISSPLAEFCSSSYINSLLSFTHFIMAFSLLFPLFYVHPLPFLPHSFILIYSIFPSLSPLASLHPNLLYLPFLIPSSIIHPNLQYLPFRAGNSLICFLSESLVFCEKVSE